MRRKTALILLIAIIIPFLAGWEPTPQPTPSPVPSPSPSPSPTPGLYDDLETEEDWEATIPEEIEGSWPEKIIGLAESQLGYSESGNLHLWDWNNNEYKGYTRYGDYYGNDYGSWCAMFVGFCLDYAGIPRDAFPYNANCAVWVDKLNKIGLFVFTCDDPLSYIPQEGDIVFFAEPGHYTSKHCGIVTYEGPLEGNGKIDTGQFERIGITTIEGNTHYRKGEADAVCEKSYLLTDKRILGYGRLSAAEENCKTTG